MHIRTYQSGEEEELWQLYYNTTHIINWKIYTKEQVERWAPHTKNMEEWRERISKKKPFVAVENNKIVGFAELENDGHIDYFYVHHEWQGKGIGKVLYNTIEKEAKNRKIPYLYAEVSLSAKSFFLNQEFEILEEKNNIICGAPAKNFIMKKAFLL